MPPPSSQRKATARRGAPRSSRRQPARRDAEEMSTAPKKPEPMPFIMVQGAGKPPTHMKKFIRSHVMKGKNKAKPKPDLEMKIQALARLKVMEAYYSIPERVGSDASLIHFADPIDAPMSRAILQFHAYWKRSMYNLTDAINMTTNDRLWVEPLAFDSLYLHSMAFTALSFTAVRSGSYNKSNQTQLLSHFSTAVRLLRERLALEDSTKFSSATGIVILALVVHARMTGDYETAKQHMIGFWNLVHLQGGGSIYNENPHLLMEMFRYDLGLALDRGFKTAFFSDRKAEPFRPYPDLLVPMQTKETKARDVCDLFPVELDSDLQKAWTTLRDFCAIMALACKTEYREPKETLHDTMVAVVYRLVYMKFESGSWNEAVRLGLLALSSSLFLQWQGLKPSYIDLPASYRSSLLGLEVTGGSTRALIWLLIIGAVCIFTEKEDDWLKPWLRMNLNMCEVKNWHGARDILESFIWLDFVHDKPGERLYKSITR
ncbi:hypothetical protein BX600DRAFT_477523 [Xylariales sp. PMI_506]|nr:hypothetical protein BX600DRAFT_477523 [Xylariales sp. PMI_506]